MSSFTVVNPFYESRIGRSHSRRPHRQESVYALLPTAPRNASPVPELTSLYHSPVAGDYGDRSYPGNCAHVLKPGGKLAVLMGDYTDPKEGFIPLTYWTKRLAFECGLRQCCTDIVRFSHGASSSRKVYKSSFIPGLHDILAVFEKA